MILPCFYNVFAQSKDGKITGKINDAQNNAVADVTVYLLLSADSSVVKFLIPDKYGCFEFNSLPQNTYLIAVSGIGYKNVVTRPYQLNGASNIYTGIIRISKKASDLKGVDIVAQKSFIETRPGKVLLNIQSSIVSTGSNALEILKKAPGVKVDNNNNIALNGKSNVMVLIDGRPTYMPPDALAEMLQGTPSTMIDQIELISNPGAAYDAASAGGIINIKLKRNENYGTNGTINASAGVQQLGDGYDSKFRGSSGINFNSRAKNLNVFGGYNYSYTPISRIFLTDRLIDYTNQVTEIKSDYFSDQSRSSNTYRLGTDYNVSPTQIVGFLVNGTTTDFTLNKTTGTNILNQGISDSTIATTSKLNSKASQFALDLNYRGNFNKLGQVAVDLDYFTYDRNPLEEINSNYFNSANNQLYRSLAIQNSFPSNYKIYTYNVNYDVKLSATANLTAIVKTDYVKTHNTLDFGEIVNDVYTPDPRFTNQFDFTETINAAAVDYNKTFNKMWAMEVGLRVEQTISDGQSATLQSNVKNNYVDLFPDFKVTDMPDNDNLLQLTYSRRNYRPLYTDLNPFIAYQDQYNYYMGNPYLKPVYTNTIELEHIYKNRFSTTLQFSVYNNFIQSVFNQNDSTKILVTHKVNLGNRYIYGIRFNDQIDFTTWWNANFNLNVLYQRYTSAQGEGYLNSGSQDIDLKIQQFFAICKDTKAEIAGEYETPTTYGIYQYKSFYTVDASISKSINKRATLALNANDIFNTSKNRISSTYQNLNITGNDKIDFRVILLSFTYKFGSKTVKDEGVRKTGAEAEQGRISNGMQ